MGRVHFLFYVFSYLKKFNLSLLAMLLLQVLAGLGLLAAPALGQGTGGYKENSLLNLPIQHCSSEGNCQTGRQAVTIPGGI